MKFNTTMYTNNFCMSVSQLFFQFLQYFIPKNAFAKGIARASKGFGLAIDVLKVFEQKVIKHLKLILLV